MKVKFLFFITFSHYWRFSRQTKYSPVKILVGQDFLPVALDLCVVLPNIAEKLQLCKNISFLLSLPIRMIGYVCKKYFLSLGWAGTTLQATHSPEVPPNLEQFYHETELHAYQGLDAVNDEKGRDPIHINFIEQAYNFMKTAFPDEMEDTETFLNH